jgi:hypothetical protein
MGEQPITGGDDVTPKPCGRCGGPCHPNREICTECWLAEYDPSPTTSRAEFGAIWAPAGGRPSPVDVRMTFELLPDEQERALATELGMPPGAAWLRAGFEGAVYGPALQGYTLEFFGIPHRLPTLPDGPVVYLERLTAEGRAVACNLQAWLTKVTYRGSSVYGEVRWHPARGETVSIGGLELGHGAQAVQDAQRGLTLLRGSGVLRGRRRLEESDDSGWAELAAAAIEYRKRTGATWRQTVDHLGLLGDDLDDELDDWADPTNRKRREDTAIKRLRRYVRRLEKTGR